MVGVGVGTREELVEDEQAEDVLSMEEPATIELSIGEVAMEVVHCCNVESKGW